MDKTTSVQNQKNTPLSTRTPYETRIANMPTDPQHVEEMNTILNQKETKDSQNQSSSKQKPTPSTEMQHMAQKYGTTVQHMAQKYGTTLCHRHERQQPHAFIPYERQQPPAFISSPIDDPIQPMYGSTSAALTPEVLFFFEHNTNRNTNLPQDEQYLGRGELRAIGLGRKTINLLFAYNPTFKQGLSERDFHELVEKDVITIDENNEEMTVDRKKLREIIIANKII